MVRAANSGSVLVRQDDPLLFACFQHMTEQLWSRGWAPASPDPQGLCPMVKQSARLAGGTISRAKNPVKQ